MGGLASSFDSRRRRRAKETKRLMTEWGAVPVETPVIVTRDSGEKQATKTRSRASRSQQKGRRP